MFLLAIVENNPKKFKIDCSEIDTRKAFIDKTKEEVQVILFLRTYMGAKS